MFKTKTLHLKTKTFLWCMADRKAFFIFGRKRKCRRKWNSIYGRKRKRNWTFIFAEKRKRKSPANISVFFFFFIHSVTKSALQCATSSSFAFLQVVLVDGIPLSSCRLQCICGIFLHDISTREQFAFLVYCYRVKTFLYNLCTVLYWRLCGLTNSPHC